MSRASSLAPRRSTAGGRLQLYLDWDRFVGQYLIHLDDEERTLFPKLDAGDLPPVSIVGQRAAAQPPEQRHTFLEKLWSTVTLREREAIELARSAPTSPH